MASFLSSNGCVLANFDNHLKLSTHAYFELPFHSMFRKYENSKKYNFMTSLLMNSVMSHI